MEMCADGNTRSCSSKYGSPVSSNVSANLAPIRALISAAAAFVKVTTKSSRMDNGRSLSCKRWIMRSTSTAVFPEPAAAATNKVWDGNEPGRGASIACCWSAVHFIYIVSFPHASQTVLFAEAL